MTESRNLNLTLPPKKILLPLIGVTICGTTAAGCMAASAQLSYMYSTGIPFVADPQLQLYLDSLAVGLWFGVAVCVATLCYLKYCKKEEENT